MNTLIFLSGVGVGALASCLAFMAICAKASSGAAEARKQIEKANSDNARLLQARNDISIAQVESLKAIHTELATLAGIAKEATA